MQNEVKSAKYQPLLVIIGIIILAAAGITHNSVSTGFMHNFMGLFLTIFAMFKLFDVQGFAEGFRMYDIIAKRLVIYAVAYPFIELLLGLAYLFNIGIDYANVITAVIMFIGAYGVIKSVNSGLNIHCSCLGTFLKVPLSAVSIIENLGMGVMALIMLL